MRILTYPQTQFQVILIIYKTLFLVEKAVRYDIKGKKYINTPAKYYFVDLGLRNARLSFRQQEYTHIKVLSKSQSLDKKMSSVLYRTHSFFERKSLVVVISKVFH